MLREVTAIRSQKRGRGRVNIFFDGGFALSLGTEVVARAGLKEGDKLSGPQIEALAGVDLEQRCYAAALAYLGYRARSHQELRGRLMRRSFDQEVIDKVLNKLGGQGLVDDEAFAHYWLENRESFNPRGQQLLKRELLQKGIAEELAAETVSAVDEEASALRVAQRRSRTWPPMDYREFRRRLAAYLGRRGFRYEAIKSTVNRLWAEGAYRLDT